MKFQSTPPCGGDKDGAQKAVCCSDFNPRPHAGATLSRHIVACNLLFQSTPPCGGDFVRSRNVKSTVISIHAPMRGRPIHGVQLLARGNFNPRPHAGATSLPVLSQ